MCFEIELVGGAADGRRLTLCGDPMDPQPLIAVAEQAPPRTYTGHLPTAEEVQDLIRTMFQVAHYIRDPKPRCSCDGGPTWYYRRKPQPAAT
ncbi:hypothetical protein ACFZAR_44390 [Streptomyces sp. NPDC008222]|uniref:hypothetical protein n=1 Tax=Streptomyces sp. NPDC008222 TaxID=3364820 RepID=UPI0036E56837